MGEGLPFVLGEYLDVPCLVFYGGVVLCRQMGWVLWMRPVREGERPHVGTQRVHWGAAEPAKLGLELGSGRAPGTWGLALVVPAV